MGWRELTDDQLAELAAECDRRVGAFAAQGVTFQGLGEHWIVAMLEQLLGESAVNAAREHHLVWLKAQLDEAEPKIRQAKILQGIAGANGHPPAPNREQRRHG